MKQYEIAEPKIPKKDPAKLEEERVKLTTKNSKMKALLRGAQSRAG